MKIYLHEVHLYDYIYTLFHHKQIDKKFLDNKTYNWPLVKTIVNHRHQAGCHHSEVYLRRSKESNNQGIKVQVKRTLKSYSFLSRKKDEPGSAWNFPEPWVIVPSKCLNPHFKINVLLFCCPLFFTPPGHDQQNGKHCHLLSQSFRITLKDISSNISLNPIGLSSLHKF